jgi:hypothetical protein
MIPPCLAAFVTAEFLRLLFCLIWDCFATVQAKVTERDSRLLSGSSGCDTVPPAEGFHRVFGQTKLFGNLGEIRPLLSQ